MEVYKMKNLHINDSYNTWNPKTMKNVIDNKLKDANLDADPKKSLNRTYSSMYVEWGLHNIGYYATKPFTKKKFL